MPAWRIEASVFNTVWNVIYPRIMGRVWEDPGSQTPDQFFTRVYGKTLVQYINSNRAHYVLAGWPLPAIMQPSGGHDFYRALQDIRTLSGALLRLPGLTDDEKLRLNPYRVAIDEILERLEELPVSTERTASLYRNLAKDWLQIRSDFLDGQGQNRTTMDSILQRIETLIADYETNNDPANNVFWPDTFAIPDSELLIQNNVVFQHSAPIPMMHDGIHDRLCYDIIITDKGIVFAWPVKPLDEKVVYDAYVVRNVGTAPIDIPGLNLGGDSLSGFRPTNPSGPGAGPGGGGTARCFSVIDTLRDIDQHLQTGQKIEWSLKGEDFQRLQRVLPRVIAAAWGDEVQYTLLKLMARDKITETEEEFVDNVSEIESKRNFLEAFPGRNPALILTTRKEIAELEAELHRILNALGSLEAELATYKSDALNAVPAFVDAASAVSSVDATAAINALADIRTRVLEMRTGDLFIAEQDIVRTREEVIGALDLIDEINTRTPFQEASGISTQLATLRGILDDARQTIQGETVISDAERDDVKEAAIASFRRYFALQAEFAFPIPRTAANAFSFVVRRSDEQGDIVITDEGIEMPFPLRPSIDKMYTSWGNGEAGIPTFTNTGS